MSEKQRLLATLDTRPQQQLKVLGDILSEMAELNQRTKQTNELLAALLDATNFKEAKDKKHGKK